MLARPLPKGGTIGVPSPSSPYENRSEIDRGIRWWESRGYKVKLASGVYTRDDYGVIADNAKPLIGYSDITALHVAIRQRTGLVTFYGPGLTSMGNPKKEWTKERALRALSATDALGEVPPRQDDPYVGALN